MGLLEPLMATLNGTANSEAKAMIEDYALLLIGISAGWLVGRIEQQLNSWRTERSVMCMIEKVAPLVFPPPPATESAGEREDR